MRLLRFLSLTSLFLLFFAGLTSSASAEDYLLCEPPDPTCERKCQARAWAAYEECRDLGGSFAECLKRMRVLRRVCTISECGPMLDCRDRCNALSKRVLHRCLEDGGELDWCRVDARKARQACIERRCEGCPCPKVYDPVCGIDGVTYGNSCEADCADVEIDRRGPCEPRCEPLLCDVSCEFGHVLDDNGCPTCECKPQPGTCETNQDCREGETCRKICPLAPCILGQPCPPCVGVCVDAPDLCRDNGDCQTRGEICYPPTHTCRPECAIQCLRYDPVCGEDGVTYGCGVADAHCHGVEVAHHGECGIACTQVYDPVCGVDRRTYSNACFAGLAGVSIWHKGPCVPFCQGLACNLYCPQGYEVDSGGCPVCDCLTTGSDPLQGGATITGGGATVNSLP